jgi:hypothetical protein
MQTGVSISHCVVLVLRWRKSFPQKIVLRQPKAPFGKTFASEVQTMKNRDCFISASVSSDGIAVNSEWTFAQLNDQVRQWFPQVFTYLDLVWALKSRKSSHKSTHPHPDWCVLVRSGSQFTVLEVSEPNGSTLFENKGHWKANVAESVLWFGK